MVACDEQTEHFQPHLLGKDSAMYSMRNASLRYGSANVTCFQICLKVGIEFSQVMP